MKKHQPIFTYIIIFFLLSILLRFFGIIDFNNWEIIGYAFIIYGLSLVYISMGKNKKFALFSGSSVFLTGIVLFIISNFHLMNYLNIIISSIILIIGIDFFIIFIDDFTRRNFLILSAVFIITGLLFTISWGSPSFASFFSSVWHITMKYWPVVLILAGIILIIRRGETDKSL